MGNDPLHGAVHHATQVVTTELERPIGLQLFAFVSGIQDVGLAHESSRMQGESLTAMGWEGDPDFVDRLDWYPTMEGESLAVKRRTLVISLLITLGVVTAAWAIGVPSRARWRDRTARASRQDGALRQPGVGLLLPVLGRRGGAAQCLAVLHRSSGATGEEVSGRA